MKLLAFAVIFSVVISELESANVLGLVYSPTYSHILYQPRNENDNENKDTKMKSLYLTDDSSDKNIVKKNYGLNESVLENSTPQDESYQNVLENIIKREKLQHMIPTIETTFSENHNEKNFTEPQEPNLHKINKAEDSKENTGKKNEELKEERFFYLYHPTGLLQKVTYKSSKDTQKMEYLQEYRYKNVEPLIGPIYTYDPESLVLQQVVT